MTRSAAILALTMIVTPAGAAEIASVYTDLDPGKTCITISKAEDGEGDWSTQVCAGFQGFPVIIDYDDGRETVFYGFSPTPDRQWESFGGFNAAGKKVEWRLLKDGDVTMPFATINRWSVSDPEDADKQIEVLVVSKVGQLKERQGCVVGLVRASGNPQANEMARKIADEQVREFSCGDERTVVGEQMPEFVRETE